MLQNIHPSPSVLSMAEPRLERDRRLSALERGGITSNA
jgi:hypothetical protein